MTPEQSLAWQRSKLDCKCAVCGATSAATSSCYRCHSTDLTYRTHGETPERETLWCRMSTPDRRPKPRRIGHLRASKAPVAGSVL